MVFDEKFKTDLESLSNCGDLQADEDATTHPQIVAQASCRDVACHP